MVRVLILALISICFSVLKIQADCNLPTGGACSLEDLRKEQENFSKSLPKKDELKQVNENEFKNIFKWTQKDPPKQVDLNKTD